MALCKVKIGLLEAKTISDNGMEVFRVGSFGVEVLEVGSLKVSSSGDGALEVKGLKVAMSSSSSIATPVFLYFIFFFSLISLTQQQDRNVLNILKDDLFQSYISIIQQDLNWPILQHHIVLVPHKYINTPKGFITLRRRKAPLSSVEGRMDSSLLASEWLYI